MDLPSCLYIIIIAFAFRCGLKLTYISSTYICELKLTYRSTTAFRCGLKPTCWSSTAFRCGLKPTCRFSTAFRCGLKPTCRSSTAFRCGLKPTCRSSTRWVLHGVESLQWRHTTSLTTTATGRFTVSVSYTWVNIGNRCVITCCIAVCNWYKSIV